VKKLRRGKAISRLKVPRQDLGGIIPLVRLLEKIQKQAAELGLFAEDRDLLECPQCGLQEDVSMGGLLIVSVPWNPGRDTGLRFSEVKRGANRWRCGKCEGEFYVRPGAS
jgi:ribosomal protein S27AE